MSDLDNLLLGLLHRRPRTGYALAKVLSELPITAFSGSPGAIYPALASLRARGLIQPVSDKASARRRTVYGLSQRGRRVFINWLQSGVDRWDLLRHPDLFMLRVSFIRESGSPESVRQFVEEVAQEAAGGRALLTQYRAAAQADLSEMSTLAIDLAEELLAAYQRWARRARS